MEVNLPIARRIGGVIARETIKTDADKFESFDLDRNSVRAIILRLAQRVEETVSVG